jgi:hypothetical protein
MSFTLRLKMLSMASVLVLAAGCGGSGGGNKSGDDTAVSDVADSVADLVALDLPAEDQPEPMDLPLELMDNMSDLEEDILPDVDEDLLTDVDEDLLLDVDEDLLLDVDEDLFTDLDADVPPDVVEPPEFMFVIISVPMEIALADAAYEYKVRTDAVGMPEYSLTQAPDGMSIDPKGNIMWQPAVEDVGAHEVTVQVTLEDVDETQDFTIVVNSVTEEAAGSVDITGGKVNVISETSEVAGAGVGIPSGALGESVDIELGTLDSDIELPGMVVGTQSIPLVFGPAGMSFKKPVTIHIPYDASLADKADKLQVLVYQEDTGEWSAAPVIGVDVDNHLLMVQTDHFSIYMAGEPELMVTTQVYDLGEIETCAKSMAVTGQLDNPLVSPLGDG